MANGGQGLAAQVKLDLLGSISDPIGYTKPITIMAAIRLTSSMTALFFKNVRKAKRQ